MLLVWNGRVAESCEFCINYVLQTHGTFNMLQFLSIYHDLNVSGILVCWIFTGYIGKVLYTYRVLNMSDFWICSGNNFKITLNSNIKGKFWKIRYVPSVYITQPTQRSRKYVLKTSYFWSKRRLRLFWKGSRDHLFFKTSSRRLPGNVAKMSSWRRPQDVFQETSLKPFSGDVVKTSSRRRP